MWSRRRTSSISLCLQLEAHTELPMPQNTYWCVKWGGQGSACVVSAGAAEGGAAAGVEEPPPCCGNVAGVFPRCWRSRPRHPHGRNSRTARWTSRWRPGWASWWTACPCSQSQDAWGWARNRWTGCRLSSGWSCYAGSPWPGNKSTQHNL